MTLCTVRSGRVPLLERLLLMHVFLPIPFAVSHWLKGNSRVQPTLTP